ncbi:MAG: P-loop NTPase, partial [Bryobacterales bacterium]|nr:P-loop NTPase [Bryobacterales bacterium]
MPKNLNGNADFQSPEIHLTLQGKGGVGKSLVAAVLAQYLRQDGRDVRCIDTDPVNGTLAQYTALAADRLRLRDEHNRIEQRAFDALMERFLTEETATFVVDNGASTFLPLWHYILENDALRIIQCKMSMKSDLFPMQDEHGTGRSEVGMLRPDAGADAECRTAHPGADPGVSGFQPWDRVRGTESSRGVR